jgi:hypothetical protein
MDEIINSDAIPNADNPLHVEAMLELLGLEATQDDAIAACKQARREGLSFRKLTRLMERASVSDWAYHRLDRFLRRAFGWD